MVTCVQVYFHRKVGNCVSIIQIPMLSRTVLLHDSRFCAVFRIVDILLRIRIRGSAPLINESVSDLQDANKLFIFSQFFC
jgi:hypothetical protein